MVAIPVNLRHNRQYVAEGDLVVNPADIGRAIVVARKREHLNQSELAALSGTSVRTLRDVENGTGKTSLETVLKIADAVGVSIRLEDD